MKPDLRFSTNQQRLLQKVFEASGCETHIPAAYLHLIPTSTKKYVVDELAKKGVIVLHEVDRCGVATKCMEFTCNVPKHRIYASRR